MVRTKYKFFLLFFVFTLLLSCNARKRILKEEIAEFVNTSKYEKNKIDKLDFTKINISGRKYSINEKTFVNESQGLTAYDLDFIIREDSNSKQNIDIIIRESDIILDLRCYDLGILITEKKTEALSEIHDLIDSLYNNKIVFGSGETPNSTAFPVIAIYDRHNTERFIGYIFETSLEDEYFNNFLETLMFFIETNEWLELELLS